ncbi:zinc finger protein 771-like isoform X1 [Drosophila sulfurigaster albostrigata]|uniref:zinc finger protein 771-like isoform X1 n=1 Tax=Drosophila sulfurigaster albostrigata TaxID=89887 RepID=UPI002D21C5DE|nr:zinc finger protein 771-like isoform X1 [Drosophila sulfurigaster albostrigata]
MPMIKFSIHTVTMESEAFQKCGSESKEKQEPISKDAALRHMCEYCGYRTSIRGNLRIHRRRHTGEKPFCCTICNASFVAQYQLTTHKERHLDANQRRCRYMCQVCNVGFLSARSLYHHRSLHAAVKLYKCTMCDKSYAQAAGYAQHKRWHRQQNERVTAKSEPNVSN